jgi:hypothetical protein
MDLTLPILHLLFPTRYLDENGLDFYRTHGLDDLIAKDQVVEFEYKGIVYKITTLGLIRPDVYLDAAGQEFYRENELDQLLQNNGTVRVIHRCQHLANDNSCDIYDVRPQICRAFDCSLREDCTDTYPLDFRR